MSPPDRPTAATPDPDLRSLVELCVAQYPIDGQQVVDQVCARHPRHADALRRRMAILERSGLLAVTATAAGYPERLGDFRLLELIGEGGMGAVFKAQQVSLGRLVALKVIRAELAFSPRSRERFRREIEAIAAMRSPGIVQVHVVGEVDGVPYYAMELVEGINLHDLILELRRTPPERLTGNDVRGALARAVQVQGSTSTATEVEDPFAGTYVQACCRIALRVARTLAHTHERGLLHRDVKPSNVMIDRGGRVLLLDFGLARATQTETDGLTRTGAMVGSPAYMAPEQMRGETGVDARADVYGVGVTLYELLTHRAAFRGETQEALREQVLAGAAPSLVQLNSAIPRDAETICLKAMAPEPGRRYASAQALADDLQRFLDLRPITARRAGPLHRLRRWGQRHPGRAMALGATAVLALFGPTLFALQEHAARTEIKAALERAERYQHGYEQALAAAIAGMERTTMRLADDEDLASGRLDGLRRELLEGAASFWQTMAGVQDAPASVRDALFRARSILALTRRELGDLTGARSVLDATVAELERLRQAAPEDRRLHFDQDLAKVLFDQADVMLAQHELRPAIAALEASAAIAEASLAAAPNPRAVRRHIRRCRLNMAQAQAQVGEAEAAARGCREVIAEMTAEGDTDSLLRARTLLAAVLLHTGRLDEALPALETAIELRSERAEHEPNDVANLRDLQSAHHNIGILYQQRAELAPAREHLEKTLALGRQLAEAFPARLDQKLSLLSSIMVLANVHLRLEDKAGATATARAGVADAEKLLAEHPDVADVQNTLAEMRSTLAQVLMEDPGARREAVDLLRAAAATHEARALADGAGPDVVATHATTRGLLASAYAQSGDVEASVREEDVAIAGFEAAFARDPSNHLIVANAGRVFAGSVVRALDRGDEARVRALLGRARALEGVETTLWSLLEVIPPADRARLQALR